MKTLIDTQNSLKALLPEGIDVAINGIKAALSEGTDKYNDLLLLEGRYQDVSKQLIQGIVGDDASKLEFNKIRKALLEFIDSLQEIHLAAAEKTGVDGKPDIYNGEILYRIPKQMQKDEETKCLVRLAFDRAIITQDLEKQEGDVMKDLRISEVMRVELLDMTGNAFQIRTLHDTVQFVERDLYTEWLFYVKPILEGIHPLVLKISIIEIKDGIERKRNVVLEEKVEIIATVPEKSGVGEEFAKAGIALAVAGGQGHGGGGFENLEGSKSMDVIKSKSKPKLTPKPAPAPAPPVKSSGTSFRKIASALSALAVLLVASWAMWNALSTDVTVNPGDNGKTIAGQEDWDRIKVNPSLLDVRDFLKKHPDSEFSQKAKQALDSLDNEAWQSALAANDLNSLKDYLEKYPDGRFAGSAAYMIENRQDDIAEGPNQIPEKPAPRPTKPINETNEENANDQNQNAGDDDPETSSNEENKTDSTINEKPASVDSNEPIPMKLASRLPIYPGCRQDDMEKERSCTESKIGKFIKKNLKYPEDAIRKKIQGTVTVRFVIEKDGQVTNVQYANDIGGGCAEEAVRLVQQLPNFEPGLDRIGRPARISYILPIKFNFR